MVNICCIYKTKVGREGEKETKAGMGGVRGVQRGNKKDEKGREGGRQRLETMRQRDRETKNTETVRQTAAPYVHRLCLEFSFN